MLQLESSYTRDFVSVVTRHHEEALDYCNTMKTTPLRELFKPTSALKSVAKPCFLLHPGR